MEQKKFDYNSFIGMILIAGLMLWYFNTNKPEDIEEKITTEQVVDANDNASNTIKTVAPTFQNDSLQKLALQNKLGAFAQSAINGSEGTSVIENSLVKLTIDNKGGQIVKALIKNYKQ